MMRHVRIVSTGSYAPRNPVLSQEIDVRLGKRPGWTRRMFGIDKRHFAANDETTSFMAAAAARQALQRGGFDIHDIDCIVAACGVGEQPIPSTAVLVQNRLGLGNSGIAAFDINSTCLSFVTALDVVADAIALHRYRRVLIVSADIASCGLDWSNPEAAAIFGDGAAAVVVEASSAASGSRILASQMATYGAYQDACRLEAGGTRVNASRETARFAAGSVFKMDGPQALECVSERLPGFLDRLCARAACSLAELDVIVPHQASHFSLMAMHRLLHVEREKMVMIFKEFGNQIASSIPHALDWAVTSGKVRRGDKVLLIGTSAGISLGGLVIEY